MRGILKKKVWSILPPEDGSKVRDMRQGIHADGTDGILEEMTLAKISRYAFDRPVLFYGFGGEPDIVPSNMRRRVSDNCLDVSGCNHILHVGTEHMAWFLRRKEK